MYTYRKKIQLSHSATAGTSDINVLSLSGLAANKIADVEVKTTLFDVANQKSSMVYYRNIQIVDPSVTVSYTTLNDSSFTYAEDNTTAAFVASVDYVQSGSILVVKCQNSTGSTLNTICVIDYKINFY